MFDPKSKYGQVAKASIGPSSLTDRRECNANRSDPRIEKLQEPGAQRVVYCKSNAPNSHWHGELVDAWATFRNHFYKRQNWSKKNLCTPRESNSDPEQNTKGGSVESMKLTTRPDWFVLKLPTVWQPATVCFDFGLVSLYSLLKRFSWLQPVLSSSFSACSSSTAFPEYVG